MSQNRTLIIGGVILGAILLVGTAIALSQNKTDTSVNMPMGESQNTDTSDGSQETNSVTIQNYKFMPATIKVKKGTTVTWTNQDTAKHNVSVVEGQPEGGPKDGPLLSKGETYQFTFDTVGKYAYQCDPHPYMRGTVEVTE